MLLNWNLVKSQVVPRTMYIPSMEILKLWIIRYIRGSTLAIYILPTFNWPCLAMSKLELDRFLAKTSCCEIYIANTKCIKIAD